MEEQFSEERVVLAFLLALSVLGVSAEVIIQSRFEAEVRVRAIQRSRNITQCNALPKSC